ncbi:MAG: hypothetical protein JNL90_19555 [Planctomycetes bacterium]|nr:hypothetical protein [Planctomycetota bacterium]
MARCEPRRALLAALLTALPCGGCGQPAAPLSDLDPQRVLAQERAHPRSAALRVAAWLEATAIATPDGLAWPPRPDAPARPAGLDAALPHDLYSGSAGVVLFFAELAARCGANESGRRHFATLARRGADELLARLPASARPGEPSGLWTGLAGSGATLLEAGRLLAEPRYVAGALRVVALLQQAAELAGHGVEWSPVTDVIDGNAGIGLFLLAAHEQTGDPLALELALRTGRRLEQLSRREPIGRSWEMEPGFARVMPNFAHGTAGIAYFLARLAEASGEERFLDAARDGADHLLALADRSNGGCQIGHHSPGGEELHYLGWCHGPAGSGRLFAQLARQCATKRDAAQRYGDAARGALQSLLDSGLPAELPGFWNNVGQCCGSAGVIEFLLELAASDVVAINAAERELAMQLARRLADDLLARGRRDPRGLSFPHAEQRTRPDAIEAQCGYMQGAAGIGLALLHLGAVTERVAVERAAEGPRAVAGWHAVGWPDELAVRFPDRLLAPPQRASAR